MKSCTGEPLHQVPSSGSRRGPLMSSIICSGVEDVTTVTFDGLQVTMQNQGSTNEPECKKLIGPLG